MSGLGENLEQKLSPMRCLFSFNQQQQQEAQIKQWSYTEEDNFMTNFIRLADKPGLWEGQSTLHFSTSQKQPPGQEEGFCSESKFSPALSAQGPLQ